MPDYQPGQHVPINIFLARADPRSSYAQLLQDETKNKLSVFLQNVYKNPGHPVLCRMGDWKDGFQDAAFIYALYTGMKGQPTIVINPVQTQYGAKLSLNVSLWGLGQDDSPTTQSMFTVNYAHSLGKFIREETIGWTQKHLPVRSEELKMNVGLLESENEMLRDGGRPEDAERLLPQYVVAEEIRSNVVERFSSECANQLACVAGMCSDIYYLIEYGASPRLPHAIATWNSDHGTQYVLPKLVAEHYQKTLTCLACSDYLQDRLPLVYLETAKALSYDPEKAEEIFREGIGLWANRKADANEEVALPKTIDDCVRLVRENADDRDRDFVQNAHNALRFLGKSEAENDLKQIALPAMQERRWVFPIRGIDYAFRWCPAGCFTMGSPVGEVGRCLDEVQHRVTLTNGFWMLETPVTQRMWTSVMGNNPSHFRGKSLPVECVNWDDCQTFIRELQHSAPTGMVFHLPSGCDRSLCRHRRS